MQSYIFRVWQDREHEPFECRHCLRDLMPHVKLCKFTRDYILTCLTKNWKVTLLPASLVDICFRWHFERFFWVFKMLQTTLMVVWRESCGPWYGPSSLSKGPNARMPGVRALQMLSHSIGDWPVSQSRTLTRMLMTLFTVFQTLRLKTFLMIEI